jgi:hypothetical protein
MHAPRRRRIVEPVPAPARELEIDLEVERHAVRHHVGEAWRQLESEIGIEGKALLDAAQRDVAYLDLLGV